MLVLERTKMCDPVGYDQDYVHAMARCYELENQNEKVALEFEDGRVARLIYEKEF